MGGDSKTELYDFKLFVENSNTHEVLGTIYCTFSLIPYSFVDYGVLESDGTKQSYKHLLTEDLIKQIDATMEDWFFAQRHSPASTLYGLFTSFYGDNLMKFTNELEHPNSSSWMCTPEFSDKAKQFVKEWYVLEQL